MLPFACRRRRKLFLRHRTPYEAPQDEDDAQSRVELWNVGSYADLRECSRLGVVERRAKVLWLST